MPLTMHHSIIRALRRAPDYETLKDALDDEVEFVNGHKRGPVVGAHVVNGEDEKEEPEGEEGEGMDPALLNAMLEAAWLLPLGEAVASRSPSRRSRASLGASPTSGRARRRGRWPTRPRSLIASAAGNRGIGRRIAPMAAETPLRDHALNVRNQPSWLGIGRIQQ